MSTTQTTKPFPVRDLLKISALTAGVVIVLAAIGYYPTARLAGPAGLGAMFVGLLISATATLVGCLPGLQASSGASDDRHTAIMIGMGLRVLVVALLGISTALSGLLPHRPLLIWLGVGYLTLLFVDTLAIYTRFARATQTPPGANSPITPEE